MANMKERITQLVAQIDKLRFEAIFSDVENVVFQAPSAEQHYVLCLSALASAAQFARLALTGEAADEHPLTNTREG